MTDRLEKFRTYAARFDAAADPARAIKRGLYVERPGRSVADEIAARVELRPASSHLIVGGIGSGKTTQLLVVRDRLAQLHDTTAVYLDVSAKHDISDMRPGVLVVLAGLAISRLLGADAGKKALTAKKQFKTWAYGGREWIPDDVPDDYEPPPPSDESYIYEPGHYVTEEGILTAPDKPLDWQVEQKTDRLADLYAAITEKTPHVVLLVDSLDRLTDPATFASFETVVEQDVRGIRMVGLGLVLAGPLRSLYGLDRTVADRFDYFHHLPAVDVQQDARGLDFLMRVLRARASADILPDASCRRLAEFSGGVLRDLISLAQAAGEEAYMTGDDTITEGNVDAVADRFGRTHMLGLGPDELKVLQRVRTRGTFVQTSDKDLALLVTRRVLEYQKDGRTSYDIHPTMRSLLEQLAEQP